MKGDHTYTSDQDNVSAGGIGETRIGLDKDDFDKFIEKTERPAKANERLTKLMSTESTRARPRPTPAPVADVKSYEANLSVSRALYQTTPEGKKIEGDVTDYDEKIRVPAFHGPTALVTVKGGLTKNMGNFNSLRVDVSVSVPCYPESSEIERAYDFASKLVNDKIHLETEYATGRHEDLVQ